MTDHQSCSAATEYDTCKFCGTTATPNDEPNCATLDEAYARTISRPYGCPWFDKESRKRHPKGRAEMSNLNAPERALVEKCRSEGFAHEAGCNLVDLVRRAGLHLTFPPAQCAQVRLATIEECAKIAETAGCGNKECMSCYGNQIAATIRDLAAQPPAAPVETERKTFTIPPGYEAVRDSEGRATGEVRPVLAPVETRNGPGDYPDAGPGSVRTDQFAGLNAPATPLSRSSAETSDAGCAKALIEPWTVETSKCPHCLCSPLHCNCGVYSNAKEAP